MNKKMNAFIDRHNKEYNSNITDYLNIDKDIGFVFKKGMYLNLSSWNFFRTVAGLKQYEPDYNIKGLQAKEKI